MPYCIFLSFYACKTHARYLSITSHIPQTLRPTHTSYSMRNGKSQQPRSFTLAFMHSRFHDLDSLPSAACFLHDHATPRSTSPFLSYFHFWNRVSGAWCSVRYVPLFAFQFSHQRSHWTIQHSRILTIYIEINPTQNSDWVGNGGYPLTTSELPFQITVLELDPVRG